MLLPHLAHGYLRYLTLRAPHVPLERTVSRMFIYMTTEHTYNLVEDQVDIDTQADRPFALATCFLLVPFIHR
jgi:hypothetical protein